MRRLLGTVLLLLVSLPLMTPLLALTAITEANLPACCRRSGAHRCALNQQQLSAAAAGDRLSTRPATCPSYPSEAPRRQHHDLSLDTASLLFAGILSHPAITIQTEARARVALDRSRHKRGPPTNL